VALAQQAKWSSIIAGTGIVFICAATLTPGNMPPPDVSADLCRGWCDDVLIADFARNIVLFLPFAFGLALAGVRPVRVLIVGSALSALVEVLQINVIVGRDASMLDWISNSIGTALGIGMARGLGMFIKPRPRAAFCLMALALMMWSALLLLGSWGMTPAPGSDSYWGQRAPRLGQLPPFLGELHSARVNGTELPSARLTDDEAIRAPLRAGEIAVEAIVRPGPETPLTQVAPIVRVADGERREIVLLGRSADELVFKLRLHATILRLQTPSFSLAGAFASDTDRVQDERTEALSARLDNGRVRLTARRGERQLEQSAELDPALAWTFFVPWDYRVTAKTAWLSDLWIGLLLVPAGYWSLAFARARRSRWPILVSVLFPLLLLVIVPAAFRLHVRLWSFVAAVAGCALGAAASTVRAYQYVAPDGAPP
jgi:hypothetical protein